MATGDVYISRLKYPDAAAARTNLGLGSIATQAANNVAISGGSVTGIADLSVADGGTGASVYPTTWYWTDISFAAKTVSGASDRYTILSPNAMQIDIGGSSYVLTAQATIDLSVSTNWGKNVAARANTTTYVLGDVIPTPSTSAYYWECTTAGQSAGSDPGSWGTAVGNTKVDGGVTWTARFANPTTAASRAGLNFYIYACQPASGTVPVFKVSPNSTIPYGYTAGNSRKLGGFHCLCVAAGTISAHPATGYLAGDIIPNSVWDLKFRSFGLQAGMAYVNLINKWVSIYLQSGTSTTTASVYAATITDTRMWYDHCDDAAVVSCFIPTDSQFQIFAEGSNQQANISTSADPVTTGGHSDTAARRMISNFFLEDCCGALWQWLQDHAYQPGSGAAGWKDVFPSKDYGQIYLLADNAEVRVVAGGYWTNGVICGSRSRDFADSSWCGNAGVGARLLADNVVK